MFKLIKVDFYDDFACMMSECPDNCCDEDWDIYIDDDTVKLYETIGVPDLYSKITTSKPHKLVKQNGKCPFITPEGLCMFHRDYGEDYLSNTCRSYPRFVSSYGDVYLETLGMSCPATVRQVLGLTAPVSFPDNIYYEEGDKIGTRPDMTEAESLAHSVISHFMPGKSAIESYKELCRGEDVHLCSKTEMIRILMEGTKDTPSERYAAELFTDQYINALSAGEPADRDIKLAEIEKRLDAGSELFSCNVNRMLMFEHVMLDSKSDEPSEIRVVIRGLIAWILLLMSFECRNAPNEKYDDNDVIDCTYKLMRIVDHGGSVLEKMLEKSEVSK